ncbi:B3 domain-containing protein Os03g0619800-like [Aegilops tauschii subsp. strangulata]|uniref:B3 domain-containing protein Os03g0619800-like n=1 Tax=Aegilops tauschii subsp. strangulata TaxID=200361 RepID=UPI001E1CA232|nr:B3 domain-containing protein Os03g0619800-like [Aegilops tauschii subsp. strangulata]
MGNPCKVCKGMDFVGKNNICVRCAKDRASSSAAPVIDGSGEGDSNTLRRHGKQLKRAVTSSPSQEFSAQDNEDIESDDLPHEGLGHDNFLLRRTDIVPIQGHGSLLEYESMEPEGQLSPPETDYGLILRSCLSGAQNEIVNALIQKVKRETVVFVAVMKICDVKSPRPLLIILKERTLVEAAQFPHENGMPVTLQIPDKSEKWHPRFYMEKGEGMLARDWLGFVCDNNVQVGDMCIFVPSKDSESSMFMVHILSAKATPPRSVTNIWSRHGTNDAMTGSAVNAVGPNQGGNVSRESYIHGFPRYSQDRKNTDRPSEHRPFVLRFKSTLTITQRKIVDERVQSIGSKYPLYVATLNPSNLQKKQIVSSVLCRPQFIQVRKPFHCDLP